MKNNESFPVINMEQKDENKIERKKEIKFTDLNTIIIESDDRKLVSRLREKFNRQKDYMVNMGNLSEEQILSIEKGYELEKVFLSAVENGILGDDISEIYKTNEYDDFINHIDGLIKLKSEDIFGFALDLTYTDSENFIGLGKKFKYTKDNIKEGHLYDVKYGPNGKIENIVRPVISLDKNDIRVLEGSVNNVDSLEISIYIYEEILEQVSKFVYYAEENIDEFKTDDIINEYDKFIEIVYSLKEKKEKEYMDTLYSLYSEKKGNSVRISNGQKIDPVSLAIDSKIKEFKEKKERKMIHLKMALIDIFGSSNDEEKKEYNNYLKLREDNNMRK